MVFLEIAKRYFKTYFKVKNGYLSFFFQVSIPFTFTDRLNDFTFVICSIVLNICFFTLTIDLLHLLST